MKKNFVVLASALLLLWSCKTEKKQITRLENKSAFDLESVNFNEDVTKLFAKHLLDEDGIRYDSVNLATINGDQHRYKISNTIVDVMKFQVPQKEFGFLYKSPTLDSVAKFQDIYFERICLLTNTNKKPVGYYAETEFKDAKVRKAMIDKLIAKYGKPKYSFFISNHYNQCSYEWVLADRTLQIETSFGHSATFSSNAEMTSGKYYKLDLLILDNKVKTALHQAHIYEFPDKILFKGKYHSYKDFQFEKKSVFKDEFLLNSTNEDLIKNENNQYDIGLAEVDK